MVLAVLLSVGAAALSWHFVESRILKLKEKLTDSKRIPHNLPAINKN
jgi:peptidoglycan/LPS O-acetylase OafA/YrhL